MTNDDYKAVLDTVRATLENALRQNEMLVQGLRYYADRETYRYLREDSGWKPIDRDQGTRAREILKEVTGR